MKDIKGKPLVVGDVIFVRSGRFMGCVLSLVGMRERMFQCRNDTYGTPTEIDGTRVNVIETRAVEFYRHAAPQYVEVDRETVIDHATRLPFSVRVF